jgi:proteasome accessory factor C
MTARTAGRLTRILAMLPWVIAHPGTPVDEVCSRFGYTRAELVRDLQLIFMCGLPGYGPGDLIYADIEDDRVVVETADYFADAPRLSPAEALALLASGMTVLASGQGSEELASAVDKLGSALFPEGEPLTIDVEAEPELVTLLRQAAAAAEAVEITYSSLGRGETTERVVEPWAVFSSLGNWYLRAHCRRAGGERVFRIDRIRRATPTGERFTPPPGSPSTEVSYSPSEDDVVAEISLGPAARWVAEYYPVEVVDDEPDELRIRFWAYDPGVAAGLLLRLGPDASLIEGDEVRSALDELRQRLLARYSE